MLALGTRTAILLAGSLLAGVAVNAARPGGVRLASFAPPALCGVTGGGGATASTPLAPVEVVPPEGAVSLCGDPQTLIADVRAADVFTQGHVSGAIHLPCAASGSVADAATRHLADRKTLIVYGDDTADARAVADEMRRRNDRPDLRILVLAGGFPAWSHAGLACSSGPCPDCQAAKGEAP